MKNKLSAITMRNLVSRLGRERDVDLAKEFGLTRTRIWQMRVERNIPRFNKHVNRTASTRLTSTEVKRMRLALKKSAEPSQSEFIRGAINDKVKGVLEK